MLLMFFVGIIALTIVDQLSKILVINTISGVKTVPIFENVFHLTYWENRGAAFGIMQNQRLILLIITIAVVVFACVYMVAKKPKSFMFTSSLTLLIGGAIGNMIDRIFKGYVVDFLDFRLIDFPIFNVADCFVVVGAILLCIYLIFIEGKKTNDRL